MLRLVPRAPRHSLAVSVGLGVMAGSLLILQARVFGRAVDVVFLAGASLRDIGPLVAWLAAVAAMRAGTTWAADVAAAHAAAVTKAHLRTALTRALLARGPVGLTSERTGELTTTMVGGVESLDAYVRQYLPQLALAILVPPIIGAAVLVIDPLSALVLAVTGPLIPLFMVLVGKGARTRARRRWVDLSRMNARFLDALQGMVTLKAFGRSRAEADAIDRVGERFRALTMDVLRLAFVSALALELLATIGTAIVAVEVGLRLLYGRMAFGPALTVLLLAPEFYRPLRALGAAFHAGLAGQESGQRVSHLLDGAADENVTTRVDSRGDRHLESRIEDSASGDREAAVRHSCELRFDHVAYSYRGRPAPALADVSFVIPPGATLALVGPSGAGKSTVARLVLRFAEPSSGSIVLESREADGQGDGHRQAQQVGTRGERQRQGRERDGRSGTVRRFAQDCPLDRWRALVAWVPQHPHLFAGTIFDNLRIARPGATADDAMRALRAAHADAFVDALPRGLDTPVGEHGARLSGGQAQRLAVARAFLKNAPLLVLDEPTAQLDPETEAHVTDAVRTLRRGRTVLLIAHRLTTVVDADAIVLLDRGRIVEAGTHESLIGSGGLYAQHVAAYGGS
jgi:thiol reductant ABC exporter CydD subunit